MRHLWLVGLLLLVWGGCSRTEPPSALESPTASPGEERKLSYQDAAGAEVYKLKLKEPGKFKLYRPDDSVVATLKVDEDRVKVKDALDQELFKIKKKKDGVEIEDGRGQRLYRIKLRDGGELKLEDAAGTQVLEIKPKEDGYEVRRADGATVAKVKAREGKVNFKSEDGKDLYVLKGVENAQAALWMVAEPLDPSVRAGLVVFFLEVR